MNIIICLTKRIKLIYVPNSNVFFFRCIFFQQFIIFFFSFTKQASFVNALELFDFTLLAIPFKIKFGVFFPRFFPHTNFRVTLDTPSFTLLLFLAQLRLPHLSFDSTDFLVHTVPFLIRTYFMYINI